MFITGDVKKLFSGVNDTGKKFITGVVDTGEQFFFPWCQKKPKSLKFIAGTLNDTAKKLFTSVNETADKFSAVSATLAIRESCKY
jgi:hypothetical protein